MAAERLALDVEGVQSYQLIEAHSNEVLDVAEPNDNSTEFDCKTLPI
jgi:hypothetical protein